MEEVSEGRSDLRRVGRRTASGGQEEMEKERGKGLLRRVLGCKATVT